MINLAERLRQREQLIGYWVVLDSPNSTERIARTGYDYVAIDAQHGLLGYRGMRDALLAIDAGTKQRPNHPGTAGAVRVDSTDPTHIGKALDAGAAAVILPMVDDADQAAAAVRACRYPPEGVRSYGPMRSALRIGPRPEDAHRQTAVIAMIETAAGLDNLDEICATPGLDGVYVGPSDLCLAVGGRFPNDPTVRAEFDDAIRRIAKAAAEAGIAAGIHTPTGEIARQRLEQGFTFASIASDLVHLEESARDHLAVARGATR